MKKAVAFIAVVLLCACNARGVRTATPEALHSTGQPEITIPISEGFQYIGTIEGTPHTLSPTIECAESHVYIRNPENKGIDALILFTFVKAYAGTWKHKHPSVVIKGKAAISDVNFDTSIYVKYIGPDPFIAQYLEQLGYELSQSRLSKHYETTSRHGYLCQITYWEPIDSALALRINAWEHERHSGQASNKFGHAPYISEFPPDKDLLEILNDFDQRANNSLGTQHSERER